MGKNNVSNHHTIQTYHQHLIPSLWLPLMWLGLMAPGVEVGGRP